MLSDRLIHSFNHIYNTAAISYTDSWAQLSKRINNRQYSQALPVPCCPEPQNPHTAYIAN